MNLHVLLCNPVLDELIIMDGWMNEWMDEGVFTDIIILFFKGPTEKGLSLCSH